MGIWLVCIGVVLMIAGVFIRDKDASWEWSFMWGLAGGSTWLGKTVAALGVIALIIGGIMAAGGGVPILSSNQNACYANLGRISASKDMLKMTENLGAGTELTPAQIEKLGTFILGGWPAIKCGFGGTYEIGKIGEEPRCTIHNRKTH